MVLVVPSVTSVGSLFSPKRQVIPWCCSESAGQETAADAETSHILLSQDCCMIEQLDFLKKGLGEVSGSNV